MSNFGFYPDSPNKIRNDGIEISIKFEKTGPTTARISWTLPNGGTAFNVGDLSYNGIVIVIDNVAIDQQRTVTDGTYYKGDPTVDTNLFAGDKISTAYVVGAFYDDKTTTYIDITGIKDKTPYYVAGFAVDNTCHYHREGVHSYSQQYGSAGTDDTAGYQLINLGVNGTDVTGLVPTSTYSFRMTVDGLFQTDYNTGNTVVTAPGSTYDINVLGSNAATFNDLINNLNYQFSVLNNPYQGLQAPSTGQYYYDIPNKKLYQWDGSTNVLLDPVFNTTQPTSPGVGSYWFEPDTLTLYQWNGTAWLPITAIHYIKAPNQLTCDDFWFDGNTSWVWDTTIWKPLTTYKMETDPTSAPQLACNSYWYDSNNHTLSYWKDYLGTCNTGAVTDGYWANTNAILWSTDPRVPATGEYWYNETSASINVWNGTAWSTLTTGFSITAVAPIAPTVGWVWYDPTSEVLQVWNGTVWVINSVLVWSKDPTVPLVGELWWNTASDLLFTWDQLTSAWKQVANFTISATNPALPIGMNVNDIWYIPSTTKMFRWDGSQWCAIQYINWPTDPTLVVNGQYYYNSVDNQWYTFTGTAWIPVTYVTYNTSPTSPTTGSYWIDPNSNALYQWNGVAWIQLLYSVIPLAPNNNALWYDTTNGVLKSWINGQWVIQTPAAFAVLDNGNLAIFSGTRGSRSTIYIVDGAFVLPPFPLGLFASLVPSGKILIPVNGSDGVSSYPTWSIEGIGTDGSSDERRDMVENILLELGYPTVNVELTKEQLDFCVDQALQVLRRSSSSPYERVYFFLDLYPQQQHYILSDKTVGFNKVVSIMGLHRMTSAFLGTAEGQGVYGQIMLQHLYQMGSFDLVSYHIMNEYVELMEKLFASNLMYKWSERNRRLSIQQNIWRKERILVDATIERTEQDIMSDRMLNNWIQTWATAEARMILAEIRGKYQTLPGAGGGVALNASDLRQQAQLDFDKCWQELDDYIATDVEQYGLGGAGIIMG